MHQLHDAEVAQRLLYHLARAFECPDAVYLAGPTRIQGGFDAAALAAISAARLLPLRKHDRQTRRGFDVCDGSQLGKRHPLRKRRD